MADHRHSWVKNYEDVDFDVPFLADNDSRPSPDPQPAPSAAAPSPSPASSPNPPKPSPSSTFPRSFTSSPLNPAAPSSSMSSFFGPGSRTSSAARITRIASEECRAFSTVHTPNLGSSVSRGSMILYRRVDSPNSLALIDDILIPPLPPAMTRSSVYSTSGDSFVSLSSDSKYPVTSISLNGERGLVAYAYDPGLDEQDPPDEEDMMHDPSQRYHFNTRNGKGGLGISSRGVINIATLVAMVIAILCLFVGYPVIAYYRDNGRSALITKNTRINATGQAGSSILTPGDGSAIGAFADYIDSTTPQNVYSFVGTNDLTYDLVFSYEFNYTGQTYTPKDNFFWEARDKGLYSPSQITTGDGQLIIRIDPLTTSSTGQFVGGMLDSKVPFCLGHGFIEVGMQEADETQARLFWAGGAWSYTNAAADNHVPAGPSLKKDISVSLSIGASVNKIPRNTPPDQLPTSVTIDYVRYYGRKVNSAYSLGACDVRRSALQSVTLDLLTISR